MTTDHEVRCAHCRQPKDECQRRVLGFEMHMHLWQPSTTAWRLWSHNCPICLWEYESCCFPAEATA